MTVWQTRAVYDRRRWIPACALGGLAVAAAGVVAAAVVSIEGGATVTESAHRGDQHQVAELVPHSPTPYVLPVADAARAAWGDTHTAYPATDVFLGCGAELVSPVRGTLLEVRRVDAYDPTVDDPATRGGRSVSILGDDGVRYYLAHFDTIVAGLRPGDRVAAGQTLGTMGDTGRTSACHLHFSISPPCPGPEWSVRRGVVWPFEYLDAWRRGEQRSPVTAVDAWVAANPDGCERAMADPFAGDA